MLLAKPDESLIEHTENALEDEFVLGYNKDEQNAEY